MVSHLGLAFSRDTDKKVYIQHKMNEDAELLAKMLEDGAFYVSSECTIRAYLTWRADLATRTCPALRS